MVKTKIADDTAIKVTRNDEQAIDHGYFETPLI